MDTILTIVDIQRVRIALLPAHTKWFDIGLTLDVDHETLCSIRREYSNDGDRLREMLSCRLKSGGNLTWTVLCAGLREPTVGRNDVANAIEKKLEGMQREKEEEIQELRAQNELLRQSNEYRSAEVNQLSVRVRSLELQGRRPQPLEEGVDRSQGLGQRDEVVPVAKPRKRPPQRIPTSIDFCWTRCKDIPGPQDMFLFGLPVVLNGTVFVRGESRRAQTVYTYTPSRDIWTALPPPIVNYFTIATLKDQLVLVGGRDKSTSEKSDKIIIWESKSRKWVYHYPPMTTVRDNPAAVGYREYLIVAGGSNSDYSRIPNVNILDTTSRKWVTAESLPSTDYYGSVLIEDTLYLVGYDTRVVLRAHVPTLISQATSATPTSSQSVWESLPNAPSYRSSPVAIDNVLITVGGNTSDNLFDLNPTTSIQLYNTTNKKWTRVGDLPEAYHTCYCTVLSGELLVLGGLKRYTSNHSVYAGKLAVQYL